MSEEIKRDNPLLNDIRARLWRLNKNWIAIISGETGSGKSFLGMKVAEYIDPTFNIGRVCFNSLELFELLRNNRPKKGSCVILDEAGASFGSRSAMSKENKAMAVVLQTFRSMNLALLLTVPVMSFVDTQGRQLVHTEIKTVSIDREKELCECRWRNLRFNEFKQKMYYSYPRMRNRDTGRLSTVKRLFIGKPSPNIIRKYEQKKKVFIDDLIESSLDKLIADKPKPPPVPTHGCNGCGHRWAYTGKAVKACCPSCKTVSRTYRLEETTKSELK